MTHHQRALLATQEENLRHAREALKAAWNKEGVVVNYCKICFSESIFDTCRQCHINGTTSGPPLWIAFLLMILAAVALLWNVQ